MLQTVCFSQCRGRDFALEHAMDVHFTLGVVLTGSQDVGRVTSQCRVERGGSVVIHFMNG